MKKYLTLSFVSIFVILTISYLINHNYSFITNLFSKKNIKIEKIAFEKSDRSAKREIYKRQPDISKIIQDLNYSPKINIDKGLKQLFSN